jgi:hypothetical protein
MDNRIFNVNGSTLEQLKLAIQLVCMQDYKLSNPVVAWNFSEKHGLIFYWKHVEGSHKFPVPVTAESAALIVWDWLKTDDPWKMQLSGWDADADHDGSNSRGWRVFVEDWGNVDRSSYAIFAVTPAYMWHGK